MAKACSALFLPSIDEATSSANKEVMNWRSWTVRDRGEGVERKRCKYKHYDNEVKAKVAKYACENCNKAVVVKFAWAPCHSQGKLCGIIDLIYDGDCSDLVCNNIIYVLFFNWKSLITCKY